MILGGASCDALQGTCGPHQGHFWYSTGQPALPQWDAQGL
jgi:hypothetical protein